jgi:serine/threonine-protein kinase
VAPTTRHEDWGSRRTPLAIGILLAIVIAIGGVVVVTRVRNAEPNASVPSATPAAVVSEPNATALPAADSAAAAPSAEKATPAVKAVGVRPSTKPRATSKPKAGCTPPYVIEADGTKRYKSECL